MVKVKGKVIEEAETDDLERVHGELEEMLEEGEGTDGDAYAYVEIGNELSRRKRQGDRN